MANPLFLPARLVQQALEDIGDVTESVRRMPDLLENGFGSLEKRLDKLIDESREAAKVMDAQKESIDALKPPLESTEDAIKSLKPELEAIRQAVEPLSGQLEALEAVRAQLERLDARMSGVEGELSEVREVVEPLAGATERIGRISDRLPGGD
jgi:chromosome segregation ATPase